MQSFVIKAPVLLVPLLICLRFDWSFQSAPINWNYHTHNAWPANCAGHFQSPINIDCNSAIPLEGKTVELINFDQPVSLFAVSSEIMPDFKLDSNSSYYDDQKLSEIRFSWLPEQRNSFRFSEMHLHWAASIGEQGSEHAIDGRRTSAELHIVHIPKTFSMNPEEDDVAVIAVLIEVGMQTKPALDSLIQLSTLVNNTNVGTMVLGENSFEIFSLLPTYFHNFYLYEGSKTTPPCSEHVTWIVMRHPIYIHENQLNQLVNSAFMKDGESVKIGQTFREIQPLNGRQIYSSMSETGIIAVRRTGPNIIVGLVVNETSTSRFTN